MKILVMNLGSTSTKLAVYDGLSQQFEKTLRHTREELPPYPDILAQEAFREEKILAFLSEKGESLDDMDIIATRGGLVRPIPGGVFLVDETAAQDARCGKYGAHSTNVGLLIAHKWSLKKGIPAVFTDAPVTDELSETARVSGFSGIRRRSVFHALNMKHVARKYCEEAGIKAEESRLIVAHMGGGVSVAALHGLKAIDVNSGTDGDGPFSPERAGSLPLRPALKYAFENAATAEAAYDLFYRQGGLYSYFGTNDVQALIARAKDEEAVRLVLDGMVYMIAKQIAAMAVPLSGKVQRILLTGGIAYNEGMMKQLSDLVSFIAPVSVYPGEDELAALAMGAYRYLSGETEALRVGG